MQRDAQRGVPQSIREQSDGAIEPRRDTGDATIAAHALPLRRAARIDDQPFLGLVRLRSADIGRASQVRLQRAATVPGIDDQRLTNESRDAFDCNDRPVFERIC